MGGIQAQLLLWILESIMPSIQIGYESGFVERFPLNIALNLPDWVLVCVQQSVCTTIAYLAPHSQIATIPCVVIVTVNADVLEICCKSTALNCQMKAVTQENAEKVNFYAKKFDQFQKK